MNRVPILNTQRDEKRLQILLWIAAVSWTLLVVALLYLAISNENSDMLELARQEAVANYHKDQAFRVWGTKHGGVYVPVSEQTPRNPYLAHIPERDLVTPSGRELTLMNPAYMLRQMMGDYNEHYGVKGKITSLNPINPINTPDEWEIAALKGFEAGETERIDVREIDGHPFLRLMRPMIMNEGCVKCHGEYGYQVGDVRGGVGVSVPLAGYIEVTNEHKQNLLVGLGLIWVIGMVSIQVVGRNSKQRVKERKQYEEKIWHQANFDTLTGLSNRSLFLDRLERALAYARRHDYKLALLFIDLDGFKDVNDTLGHAHGDLLLQEAAKRLQACVREMDTVSRLGGDEFTVILPELAESISAATVAGTILTSLARPYVIEGHETQLTASIGITVYPQDGDDPGMLLQNADTAMYRAKAEGRNTFRYFTWEMNKEAGGRVAMEASLRRALRNGEFELHYQPILNARDGGLIGAEALIRWISPENGIVGPSEFIPLAEKSGLIIPIGEWVMRQAASDLAKWDAMGLKIEHLSVNVSMLQFQAMGFTKKMLEFLASQPHLQSRLLFEITESVYMDESRDPGARLDTLRKEGVGIAIDDFGTGYSSLGYLKRFPVDKIKIDRSFIRDVINDPDDASLCEAIIAMAHHLKLRVVAEGVETEQQLQFLQERGCDFAQGFLFSKPIPNAQFTDYMKNNLEIK
ncbi:EAL domain-containing protein [Candidatus Thiodiazotropha sp. CDECU1]|uniref:EAL domain-containing protein n=1 Tax=Candidatus Thiodiazotropha sp. CDECU1 TaxID=3065865 RepID=UPI002930965B|nr:EAL domain-containing protein [Candidatus Thiodiazotropha sp. CDECU1]